MYFDKSQWDHKFQLFHRLNIDIEQQHALEAMHESVGIYLNIAVDEEHTTKHPDYMQSRRLSLKGWGFYVQIRLK